VHSSSEPVGQCCRSSQLLDASAHDVPQKLLSDASAVDMKRKGTRLGMDRIGASFYSLRLAV